MIPLKINVSNSGVHLLNEKQDVFSEKHKALAKITEDNANEKILIVLV